MISMIEQLQREGATRHVARRLARQGKAKGAAKGRPRNYVFRYQQRDKTFTMSLQFKKSQVPRDEIVRALQAVIEDLTREEA
jgi:hypothetical protein